jgi:hypothetical protein
LGHFQAGWHSVLPAVLVALGLATGAHGASRARFAQPGDISCALTLLTSNGTISAGEPLIARLEIRNQVNEEVGIWDQGTFLDVYDANGKLLATMPRPRNVADFAYSLRGLPAGGTYSKFLIVTGLYQFQTPGLYSVRVQQLAPPQELPVLCEDVASLRVLPYNASRLEAACDDLFAPMRQHSSFGAIPMGVRTKALYSVRDDVALPYLDWLVREWNAEYAARAIRRIGTPRAERLLAALAARGDEGGEAAREAMQMSLRTTTWDIDAQ